LPKDPYRFDKFQSPSQTSNDDDLLVLRIQGFWISTLGKMASKIFTRKGMLKCLAAGFWGIPHESFNERFGAVFWGEIPK